MELTKIKFRRKLIRMYYIKFVDFISNFGWKRLWTTNAAEKKKYQQTWRAVISNLWYSISELNISSHTRNSCMVATGCSKTKARFKFAAIYVYVAKCWESQKRKRKKKQIDNWEVGLCKNGPLHERATCLKYCIIFQK